MYVEITGKQIVYTSKTLLQMVWTLKYKGWALSGQCAKLIRGVETNFKMKTKFEVVTQVLQVKCEFYVYFCLFLKCLY